MTRSPRRIVAANVAGLLLAGLIVASPGAGAAPDPSPDPAPDVWSELDAETRQVLRTDPTARVSDNGRLYYVEPAAELDGPVAQVGDRAVAAATYPYGQTFALHSKPDSEHVIFLDFDGAVVADTAWGADGHGNHPAWDPAGDGPAFNQPEQDAIQSIWARVAEDYAPFDVDITTQDPGAARLRQDYSTHVLISPAPSAWDALCDNQCGGLAYRPAFTEPIDPRDGLYYGPAFVFPGALGPDDVKAVAEAASHEAGHTLGLNHDGHNNLDYYVGRDHWAPIMGASYERPVTQWSRGEYAGANRPENDVNILAASADGRRVDEAGASVAAATALPDFGTGLFEQQAFITSASDVDVWSLGECTGAITVDARPAPVSPNLDIALQLLDSSGAVVATASPVTGADWAGDRDEVSGLGALLTRTVPDGAYYVAVDGVGSGGGSPAYGDYGSLGGYTVTQTGCDGVAPEPEPEPSAPDRPTIGKATSGSRGGQRTATARWSLARTGAAATGVQVRAFRHDSRGRVIARLQSAVLPAGQKKASFRLQAGRYRFAVRARNEHGWSPLSSRSRIVTSR